MIRVVTCHMYKYMKNTVMVELTIQQSRYMQPLFRACYTCIYVALISREYIHDNCTYVVCTMYTMYASHTESLSESSEDGGENRGKKASGKVGEDMEVGRNTPTVHLKGIYMYSLLNHMGGSLLDKSLAYT